MSMSPPEETPFRMEPVRLEAASGEALDLVAGLSRATAALGARLHPRTADSLADAVRVMNCYYSNLIEGHDTGLREIEAALAGRLEADEGRRNLQIEARAHIRLQEEVDRLHAAGRLPDPASADFVRWVHAEFYRDAPEAMLAVRGEGRTLCMRPGRFRSAPGEEVAVGRHHPPPAPAVAAFMRRFEEAYDFGRLGPGARVLAIAAAHHRLNFIHPFLDGNGRVSRLVSHAMALRAGVGAHGLWSVSRGLARGLGDRGAYKRMMDHADTPRQGDLDGRGNLSARALAEFTAWFLRVCLDQVEFMGGLFALDSLGERLRAHAAARGWRREAGLLLDRLAREGELPRGDAGRAAGLGERNARAALSTLAADGLVGSDTPKGPVSLRFPPHAMEALFPALFAPA